MSKQFFWERQSGRGKGALPVSSRGQKDWFDQRTDVGDRAKKNDRRKMVVSIGGKKKIWGERT